MAKNHQEEEKTTLDKLNSNLGSASETIARNKHIIFWIVGGIAVVTAFVLSYFFIYRNPKINRGFEAYNQVEIAAMGNDSIAAAQYKKVSEEYGGTDAGSIAALSAAEHLYNLGKYEEAINCLEIFSTSEPVLAANSLVLKGDCYVNLKKYDDAIHCYKKAVDKADKNPQIVPRVLLKEANVYEAMKKYDDALECYEDIKDDYPAFELGNGDSIDAYIAREKARLGK